MITKLGLRKLKFVVPTHTVAMPAESFGGALLMIFPNFFTCFLYDLLAAAYGLRLQLYAVIIRSVKTVIVKKRFIIMKVQKKLSCRPWNNEYNKMKYCLWKHFCIN